MVVRLPPMVGAHEAAWTAVLEVAGRVPDGWTLVGGGMVQLHCWERGASPARPTEDADVVLDVRARPAALRRFTGALQELGFRSPGSTPSGHEHRWRRGGAQIDVLLPDGIGAVAAARTGITGSTTLQAAGGSTALRHTELVEVTLHDVTATVPRPHLAGALLVKARAFGNPQDSYPDRHALDVAVLAALLTRADAEVLTPLLATQRERRPLAAVVGHLEARRPLWIGVAGAEAGVARLRLLLSG